MTAESLPQIEFAKAIEAILFMLSQIPYNNTYPVINYIDRGIDPIPTTSGTHCRGKLKLLVEVLNNTYKPSSIQIIKAEILGQNNQFADLAHYAAIIDGYYIDPFLWQSRAIRIPESEAVTAVGPSVISGFQIEIQKDGKDLNVEWFTEEQGNRQSMIRYRFNNYESQRNDLDSIISIPTFLYAYYINIDYGYVLKISYNSKKDLLNINVFNSLNDIDLDRDRLQILFNVNLSELLDTFRYPYKDVIPYMRRLFQYETLLSIAANICQ